MQTLQENTIFVDNPTGPTTIIVNECCSPIVRWLVMVIQDMTVHRIENLKTRVMVILSLAQVMWQMMFQQILLLDQNKPGISIEISTLNGISNTVGWSILGREMWHTVIHAIFSLRSLVDTGKPLQ